MDPAPGKDPVVIFGAGPAGLTAGLELTRRGVPVVILEKTSRVGGIARTDEYRGYRFDIGGHRFFTKVPWVMEFWKEMMGPDFLERERLSHIFYRGKFFRYPVKPWDVLEKLGVLEAGRCFASYLWAQVRPRPGEETFEDYIVNHFGERLFRHFFKAYTEKVWGIPCAEIRAAWAAQRIKGMSILGMLQAMLNPDEAKFVSLIERFHYPRLGPGMMWERVAGRIVSSGLGEIRLETEPAALRREKGLAVAAEARSASGARTTIPCRAVISSMPLRELLPLVDPPLGEEALRAAARLHYRDFLTVALIVNKPELFADTWIYVHDPSVQMGRMQNFKNWSPDMVPDPRTTCVGLEYFLFDTDPMWSWPDERLVALGSEELSRLGLARKQDILDGTVVRMPKAYPTYDRDYEAAMPAVRSALAGIGNLYPVGRNGMHKYNNQDHAMVTAKMAVENIFGAAHDIWAVNADDLYHEEVARELAGKVR